MIGRGGEKAACDFAPVFGRRQGQRFLAVEMMEEAALGQAGCLADILNARGRVAFGTDHVQRRVEEPGLRFVSGFD